MTAVRDTRRILTVEEHNVIGGLGSAVADVIAASGKGCAFAKIGLPDCYSEVGYPEDLYCHYCIDTDGIVDKVRELLGASSRPTKTGRTRSDGRVRRATRPPPLDRCRQARTRELLRDAPVPARRAARASRCSSRTTRP